MRIAVALVGTALLLAAVRVRPERLLRARPAPAELQATLVPHENPKLPWVLFGQAMARMRRHEDPMPKVRELEAVLPAPGLDPAVDFRYRRFRK